MTAQVNVNRTKGRLAAGVVLAALVSGSLATPVLAAGRVDPPGHKANS